MNNDQRHSRTLMLVGENGMERLLNARVAVFGAGGVGGSAIEALARAGIGSIDIFDGDVFCLSNTNRQILAVDSTLNRPKAEAAAARILAINPSARSIPHNVFYSPKNADSFDLSAFDYIIDAIDTVSSKIELILRAQACGTPIISCMGTGNKLDATAFEVADITKTSVCPLAKVMRRELKDRGITSLKVVFSKELPMSPAICPAEYDCARRQTPGSISFVPPVAGMILAGEAIKYLLNKN